jgi:hypothetical protein
MLGVGPGRGFSDAIIYRVVFTVGWVINSKQRLSFLSLVIAPETHQHHRGHAQAVEPTNENHNEVHPEVVKGEDWAWSKGQDRDSNNLGTEDTNENRTTHLRHRRANSLVLRASGSFVFQYHVHAKLYCETNSRD